MHLNELFKNDKADFEYESDSYSTSWTAKAKLNNGNHLIIYCDQAKLTKSNPVWQIAFKVGGSFGKTGDGNEIEVFKKVSFLLSKFMEEKKPNNITMTSLGENRTALYKRLFKRVIPSWNMVIQEAGRTSYMAFSKSSSLPVFTDESAKMAWVWVGDKPVGMTAEDSGTDSAALRFIIAELVQIDQFKKYLTDGDLNAEIEEIEDLISKYTQEEDKE